MAAPAESAFAVIADWARQPRWQPTIRSVELSGPLGPGARVVEEREGYGQHLTFDLEFTEWVEPVRIRAHARSRSRIRLEAVEEFSVEARDADSVVTMALEFDLPLVLKPLAHGVGLEAGRQVEDALGRLRDQIAAPAGHPA